MLFHRVLITGANGLLGQQLVHQMSAHAEYDLLATARDPQPRFPAASCGYAPLDITDHEAVKRLFDDFTPTVVINCAAMTKVDQCENEREACWSVNADAVGHLARTCRTHGARLVQVSTDFVFDGADGPYREDARPNPVNFYGRSKLAGENAVREASAGNWTIARTVLVYGTAHALSRTNIALWVIDNLRRSNPIHVVTDQWRTPTYAPDLADGIEKLVRHNKTGIYHLSGTDFLTVHDFALQVARVFDLDASLINPITSAELGQDADRPSRTGFIVLKAASEVGYKPRPVGQALRALGQHLGLPVSTPSP